jgi:hypothetical protein
MTASAGAQARAASSGGAHSPRIAKWRLLDDGYYAGALPLADGGGRPRVHTAPHWRPGPYGVTLPIRPGSHTAHRLSGALCRPGVPQWRACPLSRACRTVVDFGSIGPKKFHGGGVARLRWRSPSSDPRLIGDDLLDTTGCSPFVQPGPGGDTGPVGVRLEGRLAVVVTLKASRVIRRRAIVQPDAPPHLSW